MCSFKKANTSGSQCSRRERERRARSEYVSLLLVGSEPLQFFTGSATTVIEEDCGKRDGPGGTNKSILVDSLACALSWTMYSSAPVLALPRPRNFSGSGYVKDRQIGIPDKAQRVVVSPS